MRIVGGMASGLRLKVPGNRSVRPTADRVKESVFAMLGDLRGSRVADLFAGSGALGLEALSRGAHFVAFVERNRAHERVLRENAQDLLRHLEAEGLDLTVTIRRGNAWQPERILPAEATPAFDVVFADPPYREAERASGLPAWLANPSVARWFQGALLVLEHPRSLRILPAGQNLWTPIRQKTYGDTGIAFLRAANQSGYGQSQNS